MVACGPGNMENTTELTRSAEWQALQAHYAATHETELRELFAKDATRAERMHAEALGIYLDYSKNRVTDETLQGLFALAKNAGLRGKIDAMFAGEKINTTEGRAVLHTALRAPKGASIVVDGKTSSRKCTPCWPRWRISRSASAAAPGKGTPARPSRTSSTSVLAARISARTWRRRPCASTGRVTSPSASCPTWTRQTSPRRRTIWIRKRRCSSSAPRPSPRSRHW